MASSGVWESVILSKTPTLDGVCGLLFFTILIFVGIIFAKCWHICQYVMLMVDGIANFSDVGCDRCYCHQLFVSHLMLLADVICHVICQMKPCQLDWQKLVFLENLVPLKIFCFKRNWASLLKIKQNEKSAFIYHRNYFDETIKMRDNNPMLTSKLHVLLNISAPCW